MKRRSFLKKSGLAVAGSAAFPTLLPSGEIELYLRVSVLLIFACGILCGWILGRGSGPVPSAQFPGRTVGSSPVKELPGRNRTKVGVL